MSIFKIYSTISDLHAGDGSLDGDKKYSNIIKMGLG
jgi:hypothetical protein